jgi:mono/diheme cytochrome c family protein
MTQHTLVRLAAVTFAATAFVACSHGGSTTPASAPAPAAGGASPSAAMRPSNALPAGVTPRMVAMGDSIFHARSCVRCHGADAKGATNGPDLTSGKFLHVNGTVEDFVRIITSGVPAESIKVKTHPFPMRARGGQAPALTDDEVKSIAAFLYSLNHK